MTLISLSSCTKKEYITPEVTYFSIPILVESQPNCRNEITEAFERPSKFNTLEAFHCYDRTIQYWINQYEAVEAQLNAIYGGSK